MRKHEFKTDVLVVGGGLAGTNAAMGAAENGAKVIILEKADIKRSGDIGGGVDHFLAYLDEGEPWDTADGFLEYVEKIGKGTAHLSYIESVYCSELKDAIARMARIGIPLSRPDGSFYRTRSMGQPGAYWINFEGKLLKPRLAEAVKNLGCKVLRRAVTIGLLTDNGEVCGAVAWNVRNGSFYVIRAKSTVVSTGNTNRLYDNPRINPFNTWLCPYNTGDGQIIALNAGAALTNMEYMRMTMLPKGFAAPGFNALVGMGGRFMNGIGEYYMEKSHPEGNRAPRYTVVFNSLHELRNGRGPLYIDCRHLTENDMAHLIATLGYDKDTLPEYFEQRGEDLKAEPVEITVSEGMQAGPTEVTGSGIKIDGDCATTIPGLFACGDSADHNRCVHGAVTGGYHAGKSAARFAKGMQHVPTTADSNIKEIAEKFVEPLYRKNGPTVRQVENSIRKIMAEHVGPMRTEKGLQEGLRKLGKLDPHLDRICVNDRHELMQSHEVKSLLNIGKVMATAALYRKESRNQPYHHRLDYPETDDENWCGLVVVRKHQDNINCDFEPIRYKYG